MNPMQTNSPAISHAWRGYSEALVSDQHVILTGNWAAFICVV